MTRIVSKRLEMHSDLDHTSESAEWRQIVTVRMGLHRRPVDTQVGPDMADSQEHRLVDYTGALEGCDEHIAEGCSLTHGGNPIAPVSGRHTHSHTKTLVKRAPQGRSP